jgi:hypothetical protein
VRACSPASSTSYFCGFGSAEETVNSGNGGPAEIATYLALNLPLHLGYAALFAAVTLVALRARPT